MKCSAVSWATFIINCIPEQLIKKKNMSHSWHGKYIIRHIPPVLRQTQFQVLTRHEFQITATAQS